MADGCCCCFAGLVLLQVLVAVAATCEHERLSRSLSLFLFPVQFLRFSKILCFSTFSTTCRVGAGGGGG